MSDWEVDGVADNTWSSLDEVAWIECESKGKCIVAKPGVLRSSSCTSLEPFQSGAGGSSEHGQAIADQLYQRLRTSDACLKTEVSEELNTTQESGCSAKERVVSPDEGRWYDSTPGSSISVLPLNSLDKSSSAFRGETKKEIPKYGFEGAGMCKGESSYQEDGADIVNSSCHFLLSDVCPPGGDLEFLAEVQEEARRDNLLEFGWGNTNQLEDIDKLFSSSDSILTRDFDSNPGMLWEPLSPTLGDSLASLRQPVNMPVSPEFVSRNAAKGFEAKPDLGTTSKNLSKQETVPVPGEWRDPSHDKQSIGPNVDNSCLPMQVDSYTDCTNGSDWQGIGAKGQSRGAECMENKAFHALTESNKVCKLMQFDSARIDHESTQALKESEKWKTSKGRRHGPRSKRLEDASRKPAASQRKVAPNVSQTNSSSFLYVPVVPIAQESPPPAQVPRVSSDEPISPMQCLQPVPYVHAGFGFPTHHHLPVVVPTTPVMPPQLQPQGQPVFISYQPPLIDVSKVQPSKGTFDVSLQSPTASSTMTPQEKIEKLRWRQKMQARLAVEQQQQQLINQRLIPEQAQFGGRLPMGSQLNSHEEVLGGSVRLAQSQCAEPLNWNERSLSAEGTMLEDGDESLAATVLHQLLNIASKMDTRTRLCLRDGFRRLARNAMQRRAAGDGRGCKRNSSELMHRLCTAESSSSSDQSCSQRLLTVDDIVETETNPMDRFIAHLLFHKRFPSSYTPVNTKYTPCNNSETSEPGALQQDAWAWSEDKRLSHLSPATRSSSVTGDGAISRGGVNAIPEIPTSDVMCEKTSIGSACLSQPIVSGLQLEKVLSFSTDISLQHLVERETDPSTTTKMDIPGEGAEPLLRA